MPPDKEPQEGQQPQQPPKVNFVDPLEPTPEEVATLGTLGYDPQFLPPEAREHLTQTGGESLGADLEPGLGTKALDLLNRTFLPVTSASMFAVRKAKGDPDAADELLNFKRTFWDAPLGRGLDGPAPASMIQVANEAGIGGTIGFALGATLDFSLGNAVLPRVGGLTRLGHEAMKTEATLQKAFRLGQITKNELLLGIKTRGLPRGMSYAEQAEKGYRALFQFDFNPNPITAFRAEPSKWTATVKGVPVLRALGKLSQRTSMLGYAAHLFRNQGNPLLDEAAHVAQTAQEKMMDWGLNTFGGEHVEGAVAKVMEQQGLSRDEALEILYTAKESGGGTAPKRLHRTELLEQLRKAQLQYAKDPDKAYTRITTLVGQILENEEAILRASTGVDVPFSVPLTEKLDRDMSLLRRLLNDGSVTYKDGKWRRASAKSLATTPRDVFPDLDFNSEEYGNLVADRIDTLLGRARKEAWKFDKTIGVHGTGRRTAEAVLTGEAASVVPTKLEPFFPPGTNPFNRYKGTKVITPEGPGVVHDDYVHLTEKGASIQVTLDGKVVKRFDVDDLKLTPEAPLAREVVTNYTDPLVANNLARSQMLTENPNVTILKIGSFDPDTGDFVHSAPFVDADGVAHPLYPEVWEFGPDGKPTLLVPGGFGTEDSIRYSIPKGSDLSKDERSIVAAFNMFPNGLNDQQREILNGLIAGKKLKEVAVKGRKIEPWQARVREVLTANDPAGSFSLLAQAADSTREGLVAQMGFLKDPHLTPKNAAEIRRAMQDNAAHLASLERAISELRRLSRRYIRERRNITGPTMFLWRGKLPSKMSRYTHTSMAPDVSLVDYARRDRLGHPMPLPGQGAKKFRPGDFGSYRVNVDDIGLDVQMVGFARNGPEHIQFRTTKESYDRFGSGDWFEKFHQAPQLPPPGFSGHPGAANKGVPDFEAFDGLEMVVPHEKLSPVNIVAPDGTLLSRQRETVFEIAKAIHGAGFSSDWKTALRAAHQIHLRPHLARYPELVAVAADLAQDEAVLRRMEVLLGGRTPALRDIGLWYGLRFLKPGVRRLMSVFSGGLDKFVARFEKLYTAQHASMKKRMAWLTGSPLTEADDIIRQEYPVLAAALKKVGITSFFEWDPGALAFERSRRAGLIARSNSFLGYLIAHAAVPMTDENLRRGYVPLTRMLEGVDDKGSALFNLDQVRTLPFDPSGQSADSLVSDRTVALLRARGSDEVPTSELRRQILGDGKNLTPFAERELAAAERIAREHGHDPDLLFSDQFARYGESGLRQETGVRELERMYGKGGKKAKTSPSPTMRGGIPGAKHAPKGTLGELIEDTLPTEADIRIQGHLRNAVEDMLVHEGRIFRAKFLQQPVSGAKDLTAAAPGAIPDIHTLALPPEIAHGAMQRMRIWKAQDTPGKFLMAFDAILHATPIPFFAEATRRLLTSYFLPYHVVNAANNVWMNLNFGVWNPKHYVDASKVLATIRSGKAGALIDTPGFTGTYADLVRELTLAHLLGFGTFSLSELESARRAYKGGVAKGLGKRLVSDEPITLFGREIVGAGRAASTTRLIGGEILPTVASTAALAATGMLGIVPPLLGHQTGRRLAQYLESHAKTAHVLSKLADGYTLHDAIRSAKAALNDYSDMTLADRFLFRHIFPFWGFTRYNRPLMVKLLMARPGTIRSMGIVSEAMKNALQDPEDSNPVDRMAIPDWKRDAVVAMWRKDGGQSMFSFTNNFDDLTVFLGRFPESLWQEMNPMIRGVGQLAMPDPTEDRAPAAAVYISEVWPGFGRLLGLRPVLDPNGLPKEFRMDPRWKAIFTLAAGPGGRFSTQLSRMVRDQPLDETPSEGLRNFLGVYKRHFTQTKIGIYVLGRALEVVDDELASLGLRYGAIGRTGKPTPEFINSPSGFVDRDTIAARAWELRNMRVAISVALQQAGMEARYLRYSELYKDDPERVASILKLAGILNPSEYAKALKLGEEVKKAGGPAVEK